MTSKELFSGKKEKVNAVDQVLTEVLISFLPK